MQAYALARPATRLSLRVLHDNTRNGDFIYAPRPGAGPEDAVLKAISRAVSLQCSWSIFEDGEYKIRACLPQIDANPAKLHGQGQFISIDSRPLSSVKGIAKELKKLVEQHVKAPGTTLEHIKQPFFILDIACPVESYDANVEPAKDDLLFHSPERLLAALKAMLRVCYPPAPAMNTATQNISSPPGGGAPSQPRGASGFSSVASEPAIQPVRPVSGTEDSQVVAPGAGQAFGSTMYGFNEDEMLIPDVSDRPPTAISQREDSEQLRQDITLSNPWIIAKMNAPIKHSRLKPPELQQPSPPTSDPVECDASAHTRLVPHYRPLMPSSRLQTWLTDSALSKQLTLNDTLRNEVFGGSQPESTRVPRKKRAGCAGGQGHLSPHELTLREGHSQHGLRNDARAATDTCIIPFEELTGRRASKQPRFQEARLRQSQLRFPARPRDDGVLTNVSEDMASIQVPVREAQDDFRRAAPAPAASSVLARESSPSYIEGNSVRTVGANALLQELAAFEANRTPRVPTGRLRRTRSVGLPLEQTPPDHRMHNIVYTIKTPLRLPVELPDLAQDPDYPTLASTGRIRDVDLQLWADHLATCLKNFRPDREVCGDLLDILRATIRKSNILQ